MFLCNLNLQQNIDENYTFWPVIFHFLHCADSRLFRWNQVYRKNCGKMFHSGNEKRLEQNSFFGVEIIGAKLMGEQLFGNLHSCEKIVKF